MAELKFFPCFYFFAKTFPFENIIGRTAPENQQVFIIEKKILPLKTFPVVCVLGSGFRCSLQMSLGLLSFSHMIGVPDSSP